MRKRYYVGIRKCLARDLFASDTEPTEATHGDRFLCVIGPFRTRAGAEFAAKFGQGNPHLQTVDDAERLARVN